MHDHCSGVCFSFAHTCEWKLSEHSPAVRQTLELVSQLSDTDPRLQKLQKVKHCCVFDCVRGRKQTDDQLTDLQKGLAWMIREPGAYDTMECLKRLDSWLCLRDAVTSFTFAITAVPQDVLKRGASKVYAHRLKIALPKSGGQQQKAPKLRRLAWHLAVPRGAPTRGIS